MWSARSPGSQLPGLPPLATEPIPARGRRGRSGPTGTPWCGPVKRHLERQGWPPPPCVRCQEAIPRAWTAPSMGAEAKARRRYHPRPRLARQQHPHGSGRCHPQPGASPIPAGRHGRSRAPVPAYHMPGPRRWLAPPESPVSHRRPGPERPARLPVRAVPGAKSDHHWMSAGPGPVPLRPFRRQSRILHHQSGPRDTRGVPRTRLA